MEQRVTAAVSRCESGAVASRRNPALALRRGQSECIATAFETVEPSAMTRRSRCRRLADRAASRKTLRAAPDELSTVSRRCRLSAVQIAIRDAGTPTVDLSKPGDGLV